MAREYYSDDDCDVFDEERREKFSKIAHFTLDDYLAFTQTRNILDDDWDNKYQESIEPIVSGYWNELFHEFTDKTNLCDLMEEAHEVDFQMMIKHHIIPDYDLTIFEDFPDRALGLLAHKEKVMEEYKKAKKQKMGESFRKLNKKISWT